MDYIYKEKVSRAVLTREELDALEAEYSEGMSSAQIVHVFTSRGIKFSEATFRKYVQLGLLPRSRRVGTKGKHRGSKGVYPAGTLRHINEIKRMMARDYTIDEIRRQFAFVGGELEELKRLLSRILERLEMSIASHELVGLASAGAKKRIEEAKRSAQLLLEQLDEATKLIKENAQMARDAV